jgi:GTPase SAR1 family protein
MGNWWTTEKRGYIIGIDNVGKTTMLHFLHQIFKPESEKSPTIGEVYNPAYSFFGVAWSDISLYTQRKTCLNLTAQWRDANYVIYMVDAADRERLPEAKERLHTLFQDEGLHQTKFLILGNKSDIRGSLCSLELIDALDLHEYADKNWEVATCSIAKDFEYKWIERIAEFITK